MGIVPDRPLYRNHAGQDIYWIEGANTAPRPPGILPTVLVIHDTDGTDSRRYLQRNDRGVSCHYLVGVYPDVGAPRIYKYASEAATKTHTQGSSVLARAPMGNVNNVAISLELERSSLAVPGFLRYAAALAAEILRGWFDQGVPLFMVGHGMIQTDKRDPRINWHDWCRMVYGDG